MSLDKRIIEFAESCAKNINKHYYKHVINMKENLNNIEEILFLDGLYTYKTTKRNDYLITLITLIIHHDYYGYYKKFIIEYRKIFINLLKDLLVNNWHNFRQDLTMRFIYYNYLYIYPDDKNIYIEYFKNNGLFYLLDRIIPEKIKISSHRHFAQKLYDELILYDKIQIKLDMD